ncbi:tRNA (adenosine(37)-N6)-threonylcarbamoyltransferase complex ATPase subunit type 1 TsaE [Winogradskyella ursingii]|uniref:tRNA (adenosine(37)-N6)-threonylcarbamoyltransferase complex ATPase subunit type 1 TsaE n=1 Tax=Winogradskyella ursingii TaxID=2686079 RepID=UPI001C54B0DC|nr:tRNA (adenosine(37)-N6)-threonylcarbamoyltransferase complex ATPase subunit type 1 TsaE [Winogradskyella ursingii]
MKTIEFTYHLSEIDEVALRILENLNSKTILFNGEMGAGKTTLIKSLLKVMGSDDIATSPTFSIVNEYNISGDKVFHFDFYRIENLEEAYNFGLEEYLDNGHWQFMEWAENIEPLLPEDAQNIDITKIDDNTRSLKLTIETNNITEDKAMTAPKF